MIQAMKSIAFTLNIMTKQLTWDPVMHVMSLIKLKTVMNQHVADANQI